MDNASVAGTPDRRPASVRRTATIDLSWPDGLGSAVELHGRARDLLTPLDGDPGVIDAAEMTATVSPELVVEAIEPEGSRSTITDLIGARCGSALRAAIDRALPGEREAATPLHFLLDDIAGTSLVGRSASVRADPEMWGRWTEPTPVELSADGPGIRKGRIICTGLRPGGHAKSGGMGIQAVRPAGDLAGDDPLAWHELVNPVPHAMRRLRRLDVWIEDGAIEVDAHFRDSYWTDRGVEMALHEYTLGCRVDPTALTVVAIEANPHVLPFPECPAAAARVDMLVGLEVGTFRSEVQETLRELDCCTHLNDMARGLAEVPALATHIPSP